MTLADVRRAFRQVAFAKPQLTSQPDRWTLVNLDTYYAVTWPGHGVEPHEVTTVHLLGHDIAIRPTIVHYTYDFGDGTTHRTDDPGGPYPDGTVRHTYRTTGDVTMHVTARYSADFNVDATGYRHLDDTIDITGPASPIHVYQARAQLIPDPNDN